MSEKRRECVFITRLTNCVRVCVCACEARKTYFDSVWEEKKEDEKRGMVSSSSSKQSFQLEKCIFLPTVGQVIPSSR